MSVPADLFTFGSFGKKPLKEQVTPHKISVIVLIQEYCSLRKFGDGSSFLPEDSMTDDSRLEIKFTEREKRNFMITLLQLLQSSDLTLKEMCMKSKEKLKPELYAIFLKRLQEFIEVGLGTIKDYFQTVSHYLTQPSGTESPLITKSSVVGMFLRRMILAFEKLSFSQLTDLYSKFQAYYNAANPQTGYEESQDFGGSLTDSAMSLSGIRFSRIGRSFDPFRLTEDRKEDAGGFNSQRQAEYFLLQQSFLLQHNTNEALSPSDLQDKIMEILKTNPEIAEAHFLSYLNSLRIKEYCTAFHNLFHFFDRKTTNLADATNQTQVPSRGREEEVYRRYAALNLAGLHYRFGHKEEAMAALREAIGMAQDMNDNVCLQQALAWLHRLGDQGTARTENLLERAVVKSSELNIPNLTSLGIQEFARHNAFCTAKPAQVFEFLQKSDVINCQHSQSGFMCTSYANKAALFSMYGKRECVSMMSQLILNLDTSATGIYYNGQPICVALCNLARIHADKGQYGLSFDLINNAKKRFHQHQHLAPMWMMTEQEILFNRTILNRKLAIAEQAVLNLRAHNEMEAELRSAILNKEKGEIMQALKQLHALVDRLSSEKEKTDTSPDFLCRVLLVLGEVYSQTDNPTNATTFILECITHARKHHLEYLTSLGMVYLAQIQFQIQLPDQAMALLVKNMLPILSHGSVLDQGRLLYCYVKCHIAVAGRKGEMEKREAMKASLKLLDTISSMYQSVEAYLRVKDVAYLQARLHHELGQTAERNKCAHAFKQLDSQYPTLNQYSVLVL